MNLNSILVRFKDEALTLSESYPDITDNVFAFPNQHFEPGALRLWIEMYLEQEDVLDHTEQERLVRLRLTQTVCVPVNSGLDRAANVTRALSELWSEKIPTRSGIRFSPNEIVFIRSIRYGASEIKLNTFRSRIILIMDHFEKENEDAE